jgi:hypothetical protein
MMDSPHVRQAVRLGSGFAASLLLVLLSPRAARSQGAPAVATPTIKTANVFEQTNTSGNSSAFVIEIIGTDLTSGETPRPVVFPADGVKILASTFSPTQISIEFSAPQNYEPTQISLSYMAGPISYAFKTVTCDDSNVKREFFYVPPNQASEKYGGGVAKNFDVVQISIVNRCALPILVPLAGIYVEDATIVGNKTVPCVSSADNPCNPPTYSFSLDHVTSIYSHDRQFSGARAVFFNIVQATATIGSAIEPFFASGFTQGVSILGGGFTQGATAIWKDLSASQLQDLASQSFQSTEQIAANGGSLQKFVFFPKLEKPKLTKQEKPTQAKAPQFQTFAVRFLINKTAQIHVEYIPIISAAPAPPAAQ